MFRITAITQDAGAVTLPHLIVTQNGLDFDLGEVTDLHEVLAEIHELDNRLWYAVRDFAEAAMGAITAAIAARLAAEPGYEDVAANAANGQVLFQYQGLAGEVYYNRYDLVMIFTLAGIHYAEMPLLETRYNGEAIAEVVITTLAAMPTYPEAIAEELTPTTREQKAAGVIIKQLRAGAEITNPGIAVILDTATYEGKPIRPTALVIELLRRWLRDVGVIRKVRHATHNRANTATGKRFQQWFVAYGQYVTNTPVPLPKLTSVFLAEAGNEPA